MRQGAYGALHWNICRCVAGKKEVSGGLWAPLPLLLIWSFFIVGDFIIPCPVELLVLVVYSDSVLFFFTRFPFSCPFLA